MAYRNVFNKLGQNMKQCNKVDILDIKADLRGDMKHGVHPGNAKHPRRGGAHLTKEEENAVATVQYVRGDKITADDHSHDLAEVRRKTRPHNAPQFEGE